ncbi:hypothetical protein BGZ61DRAFT_53838 [Ilyonectria robusta]|uniref:uncharacterized protein n=1 Tax=Ilyonectria robusta TaxID=1079257 RepID=UPI001E8ED2F8|nr:uncharacterized protein BGZ61DRAFT_53838 [Ilyonectria robusta]KAH8686579.1 hypothetical protein BGZ61DRAFT_53838 [Ilyonectria robusta]
MAWGSEDEWRALRTRPRDGSTLNDLRPSRTGVRCVSVMVMDYGDDDNRIDWGWTSLAISHSSLAPSFSAAAALLCPPLWFPNRNAKRAARLCSRSHRNSLHTWSRMTRLCPSRGPYRGKRGPISLSSSRPGTDWDPVTVASMRRRGHPCARLDSLAGLMGRGGTEAAARHGR